MWLRHVMLGVAFLLASCVDSGAVHPDNIEIAEALGGCDSCLVVSETWASEPRNPDVMVADFYLEVEDRLLAMGGFADETISVYDLKGGNSHQFSPEGKGPGEFSDQIHAAAVGPAGDTMVFGEASRIQFFSKDLEYVRGFNVEVAPRGALEVLDSQRLVFSNTTRSAEYALHLLSPSGESVASFRPVEERFRSEWLPIARGWDSRTVWVSIPDPFGFTLELWDAEGQSFVRSVPFEQDWWHYPSSEREVHDELTAGSRDPDLLRPRSGVVDMYDDGEILWVVLRHADPDFLEEVMKEYPEFDGLYDSFVLALDRVGGGVKAVAAYDSFSYGFTNRGRLVNFGLDSSGFPYVTLSRVEYQGGP